MRRSDCECVCVYIHTLTHILTGVSRSTQSNPSPKMSISVTKQLLKCWFWQFLWMLDNAFILTTVDSLNISTLVEHIWYIYISQWPLSGWLLCKCSSSRAHDIYSTNQSRSVPWVLWWTIGKCLLATERQVYIPWALFLLITRHQCTYL